MISLVKCLNASLLALPLLTTDVASIDGRKQRHDLFSDFNIFNRWFSAAFRLPSHDIIRIFRRRITHIDRLGKCHASYQAIRPGAKQSNSDIGVIFPPSNATATRPSWLCQHLSRIGGNMPQRDNKFITPLNMASNQYTQALAIAAI